MRRAGEHIDRRRPVVPNSPLLITSSRMLVLGLGLLTAPILARSLGPGDRGAYAAVIALLAMTPALFGLGLPMALRRRAALLADVGDTYRTIYRALPVVTLAGIAVAAGIGEVLFSERSVIERMLFVACVAAGCVFILVLCVQSSLVVEHRYRGIAVLQGTQGFITSVLIIGAWITGAISVVTLEVIYLVATGVSVTAALLMGAPAPRGPAAPPTRLLRESAAYLGTQIADTATPAAPVIVVFALLDERQAGYFSVAMTIATVPVAVAYAIGSVVYRAVAVSDGEARLGVSLRAVRSAVISAVAVCGVIAAATPIGLPLLFGSDFRAAVSSALVMTCGSAFALVSYVCMQVLAASGRAVTMTMWQLGGLAVCIVLIVLLGDHFHVTGAAWGVLAGSAATAVGSVHAAGLGWSVLRISPTDVRATIRLILHGDVVLT